MIARKLERLLNERIVLLDGGMGTMIQSANLTEADYRGARFADHGQELLGANDLLTLTRPELISDIHRAYLNAGADIIETNTFNSNKISLVDYGLSGLAYELNREGAALARRAVDGTGGARFVCGVLGPTTKTASLSSDFDDPSRRDVDFDMLAEAYREAVEGLLDGGSDLLMIETVVDTLNCKAGIAATLDAFEERGINVPLFISASISGPSGRTLSGQTVEAFWNSVRHARPLAIGLNCALGPEQLRQHIAELGSFANVFVSCHPNAGLPNAMGGYDLAPADMARHIEEWARAGLINIVGGCCGTTPEHIEAVAEAARGVEPRRPPDVKSACRLSGLEALNIGDDTDFVSIGERANVSGSSRFKKLILEQRYEEALEVARKQVENGARVIDVNMDDASIDGVAAMTKFLNLVSVEPDAARVPVVVDSSSWDIIEAGLKCIQGKAFVNSISLKEGEASFVERARRARRYGAAVLVMAFDEQGQADTLSRRVDICERSYRLLTEKAGFDAEDVAFDPNVFAVGTGMAEHDRYGVDFLEAVRELRKVCPDAQVSGGVSNVSFAFRGNTKVRSAINSVFLHHAVEAGMTMGIVNPTELTPYERIAPDLRELVEDVVLAGRSNAVERLLNWLSKNCTNENIGVSKKKTESDSWRDLPVGKRLRHALIHGISERIEEDVEEARLSTEDPFNVISGPLLEGMSVVGDAFESGKMFLPQIMKSARVMKKAIARLSPYMEKDVGRASGKGKVLLATVKGDVHDIGKSIVGVVLQCNGFEVLDLGVMVPADSIVETAIREQVDAIGVSGLIMPSLQEMINVADLLEEKSQEIPLLIGGATTSLLHTSLRIEPRYRGPVIHVKDVSRVAGVVSALLSEDIREDYLARARRRHAEVRQAHLEKRRERCLSLAESRGNPSSADYERIPPVFPRRPGIHVWDDVPLENLRPHIDWKAFLRVWQDGSEPRPDGVLDEAKRLLKIVEMNRSLQARAVVGLLPANSIGDDVEVYESDSRDKVAATLRFLRRQTRTTYGNKYTCLADFVAPKGSGISDWIGLFAVTAGVGLDDVVCRFEREGDSYSAIMVKIIADRLADALADFVHERIGTELWNSPRTEREAGIEADSRRATGIRPVPGYPCCPDHSEKQKIWSLLGVEKRVGISLTESYMMVPAASVSGYYFAHPDASYQGVGRISYEQVKDYAARKSMSVCDVERWLADNLAYEPEMNSREGTDRSAGRAGSIN